MRFCLILAEVRSWEKQLARIQEFLTEWERMQTNWLVLEPLFSMPEVVCQMTEEADLFKVVPANSS